MKWFILFSAGLVLSSVGADAQRPDTAQVLVHYKFSHVRDTNHRDQPYTEKMVLLMGKRSSLAAIWVICVISLVLATV